VKLTTRLVLLFFLLSILPVTALGYLAYVDGRKAIEDNISIHLKTTSAYKLSEYNYWIDDAREKLVILAQRPLVIENAAILMPAEPGQDAFQQAYQDLLDNHLNPNLRDQKYLAFNLIRPTDGKIILSTEDGLEGKFRENETFFLEGQRESFVDEVRYFPQGDEVALHVSTPILDADGNLLAVLVGHLNLNIITEIMQQGREIVQGEETYLVNAAHFFVTEPWLGEGVALRNTVRTDGVNACLDQTSGVSNYLDYRDVPVIGAYQWISEGNMCIITEVDEEVALLPIVKLRNQILVLGTFAAIIMAVLGYLIAQSVTRPVSRLVEGTKAVREGNLSTHIALSRKDELGQLATAFNEMTANLFQVNAEKDNLYQKTLEMAAELEIRVAERTEELRHSEERYRILAESSPEMIFVIDKNDQIQYVNKLAASQFRTTPEQVIGKPRTELFPPNIAEGQTYGLQQVLKTGQTLSSESVVEFPGGQVWLDTQLVPILDDTGEVGSVMGISRDITNRKRNEKMIQEEKALSESIINSLPGIFYLFDDKGRFLRWNRNFELVSGYSSEEMLERNPLEFFRGEEKSLVEKRIQETFIKGSSLVEANFTSRDGKSTPYLLTGIRAVMNEQTYLIGTGVDISERIKFEEMLYETNERFALATHSAQLGIYDWDIVNNVLIWDELMYMVYGVNKEDFPVAYDAWEASLHPDDAARAAEELQMAVRGEKPFDTQFRILWPDGSVKYIKANGMVLRDVDGEALRMIGLNYDITERVEMQEHLHKANENLTRSNSELERFAYVASHDLQEPLRMVTSYLQLLERRYKDRLDGDAIEFINYAVDGSNRMKTLINDLLAYSRVGTRGKEFTQVNCNEVLDRVLFSLKPMMDEANAEITFEHLPTIIGDQVQLEQLFQNLLGNALKFRGEETPIINIGLKKEDENWLFSVRDNGIGIDPQFFEKIFIIFQRLHNREKYEGTGIGLAISKRIVERHGGRIWIESEPGNGSTFYFTIPDKGEGEDEK
jgi:PAS domain S-box-containing protein